MRLHIVRHGQTDWNAIRRIQGQLDSQLDETGIAQAIERSRDFQPDQFKAVYSSSSLRTRQTTHHLLAGKTEEVIYRDDLREVRLGVWQGQMWQDIEQKYPEMVQAHATASEDFIVEGAEKSSETQVRGVSAIEAIIQQHASEHRDAELLIVSHGAIMKTILARYASVPLAELHKLPSLPNCAHCIVDIDGENRQVMQIASQAVEHTPWHDYINANSNN